MSLQCHIIDADSKIYWFGFCQHAECLNCVHSLHQASVSIFPCLFRYLPQRSRRSGQSRGLQEGPTWAPRCSSAKSALPPKAPCSTSTGQVLRSCLGFYSTMICFIIVQMCCNCTSIHVSDSGTNIYKKPPIYKHGICSFIFLL